jgi:hypothetical protein
MMGVEVTGLVIFDPLADVDHIGIKFFLLLCGVEYSEVGSCIATATWATSQLPLLEDNS